MKKLMDTECDHVKSLSAIMDITHKQHEEAKKEALTISVAAHLYKIGNYEFEEYKNVK